MLQIGWVQESSDVYLLRVLSTSLFLNILCKMWVGLGNLSFWYVGAFGEITALFSYFQVVAITWSWGLHCITLFGLLSLAELPDLRETWCTEIALITLPGLLQLSCQAWGITIPCNCPGLTSIFETCHDRTCNGTLWSDTIEPLGNCNKTLGLDMPQNPGSWSNISLTSLMKQGPMGGVFYN